MSFWYLRFQFSSSTSDATVVPREASIDSRRFRGFRVAECLNVAKPHHSE
jgi:hypothetical protein